MQKSESWDVTGGGVNILPVRQSLVKAKVNETPTAMSTEGEAGNTPAYMAGLARASSSESWDVTQGGLKILPMHRGVASKPNVKETPNWDISESESECSPTHYGGKMLPVPFSDMRDPQETPRYEVCMEETENASVTPSGNVQDAAGRNCPIPPGETPRWPIIQSIREKLPNESYRSPTVSDLPSWYMTKHGKKSATVRIGDLLHGEFYRGIDCRIGYIYIYPRLCRTLLYFEHHNDQPSGIRMALLGLEEQVQCGHENGRHNWNECTVDLRRDKYD